MFSGYKKYNTLSDYYKKIFNSKVIKISIDGGFTCPNKDGTCGIGGCIYCSSTGSAEFAGDKRKSPREQFEEVKSRLNKKKENLKYIAYFQANSNTYDKVEILKEKYESVLSLKDVVGLSIATRPDAITDECIEYLSELNKKTFLTIELGLQTIHESTSILINRCHTLKCFEDMVKKLRKHNINIVVHIINGLPYETKEMMIETIKYLNKLDIQGIKIHALSVLKNTKLADIYKEEKFKLLTKEEYIDIVCDQIEYLRSDIIIHRLTGDPDPKDLIAPSWINEKIFILNEIDKTLNLRGTYQGIKKED